MDEINLNFGMMWQLGALCADDTSLWTLLQQTAKKIYAEYQSDGFYLTNDCILKLMSEGSSNDYFIPINQSWLELLILWNNHFPQMRFWQFIVNIFGSSLTQELPEDVIVSDEEVLNAVRRYVDKWKRQ